MVKLLALDTKTDLSQTLGTFGISGQLENITDYAVTLTCLKLGFKSDVAAAALPYSYRKLVEEIVSEKIKQLIPPVDLEDKEELTIEELTFEEASKRVVEYLKTNKTAYLSEMQKDLHIDLMRLADVVQKLIKEGKIRAPLH